MDWTSDMTTPLELALQRAQSVLPLDYELGLHWMAGNWGLSEDQAYLATASYNRDDYRHADITYLDEFAATPADALDRLTESLIRSFHSG